jgi:hypothetical protein
MRRHGAAVGIGERHLAFAALFQRGKIRRIFAALLFQRLDLFRQILDPRTTGCALLGIARVEPLQIILQLPVGGLDEFLQRPRREVPVFVVDRLDARAINRQQLAPEQIKPPAQYHELPENLFECGAIVAPEIGDGLEVRLQAPQQPDDLDVAMTFGLKTAARPHKVEIAVYVQLQQIPRRVAGTARRLRLNATKSRRRQVESIDESVDEPHRIISADVIIHCLRQQQKLRTFESKNVHHA